MAAEPPAYRPFSCCISVQTPRSLDAKSKPDLELVLAEIKKRDSRDISINGHTDTTGDAKYNMKLSLDRATKDKRLSR